MLMSSDKIRKVPGARCAGLRRAARLLALAAIGVAGTLLLSCRPATEGGGDTRSANLSLLEWSGYETPKYYPEYMAKYGEEPEFAFFAQADDALKRMRTGFRVDLVHLCTGQMDEARDAGLIKPIEPDRIPRWKDIPPALLEVPDVFDVGEYWLVPWEWGYSTVAYNPESIDIDPETATYDIFIDPRFKGKTALPSDISVNFLIAAVIGGWADPLDPTEEEIQAAPEIFIKMLENARFIWSDSTQLEQAWAAGDVGISYVYGSASRRMPGEGMPIVVVEPLLTWMCGLSITTIGDAPEDQAYDYINAMLDPVSGMELFKQYGYGHGNVNSIELIDPALSAGTGIDDPVGTFARGVYTSALPPDDKARLYQLWFEAQASLD
jgi:putative spermidine/putrescine transport system substrate-binding protein/spermidine/putrescine transport system substrate-binding protein